MVVLVVLVVFPVFTGLFSYHRFSLVCGFGGFGFHQNHR
jgi:hypothetical protein